MGIYTIFLSYFCDWHEATRESNLPAIEAYNNLVNLEFILGLLILMPLLHTLNCLSKTLQEGGLLLLDAVRAVHDAHEEIAKNYLQPQTAFQGSPFMDYTDVGKWVQYGSIETGARCLLVLLSCVLPAKACETCPFWQCMATNP